MFTNVLSKVLLALMWIAVITITIFWSIGAPKFNMTALLLVICGGLGLLAAFYFSGAMRCEPTAPRKASKKQSEQMHQISAAIALGAQTFLWREYRYLVWFIVGFGLIVGLFVDWASAFSFVIGALVSILAGFWGMRAATQGNVRAAAAAQNSLARAFRITFQSGAVMGFGLSGLAIVGLMIVYTLLRWGLAEEGAWHVMEALAGFGLGGSSMALFARVGGGIYTKAADMGADLVGKVEENIPEDDPRNPAVIADNVGDNVGDIAGMGADLFGSVAESACAALVIGATIFAAGSTALLYPVMIPAVGIPICLIVTLLARATTPSGIESALKRTLIVSTVLMAGVLFFITMRMIPTQFSLNGLIYSSQGVYFSVLAGLISGMLIGVVTERYTSRHYRPVQEVAHASGTGAATNVIHGFALGCQSSFLPLIFLAATVYLGYHFAGMYGIAVAALGMLSTISLSLSIDAFGPVADNAGGIAEMSGLEPHARQRTDALDAAGNTTAAIGKGFAIGSAVLTALALFSAFLVRAEVDTLDLLQPQVIAFLLVGAMLPFLFTAMILRAVGHAAMDMIREVRRQFANLPGLREGTAQPNYRRCVDISTRASLREMILPGAQVILTPILVGFLFGPQALAGMLIGTLSSGAVLAVVSANAGGAWDNAKKHIEAGRMGGRGSAAHAAAVVGDTVGDPFKDASGPSLNILIKLQAIIGLVFTPLFQHSLYLLGGAPL